MPNVSNIEDRLMTGMLLVAILIVLGMMLYIPYQSYIAYNKGYEEAALNMPYDLNPYSSQFANNWRRGYKDYQRDQILKGK